MRTDRRKFLGASGAAAAMSCWPTRSLAVAPAAEDKIEPAAMIGDLAIVEQAYGALHPGLDRYLGRDRFAARITELKRWSAPGRSAGAWFVELGRLTAAVRCGHSYPNPVNQSDALMAAILDGRDRVPFAFRWIGGNMVVTRTLRGDVPLRPGQIIDSIDGTGAAELLRRMLPLARADGGNDAKRRALMQVDGTGRFGAFDIYRSLVAPARGDGSVLVRSGGRSLLLPGMSDAERQRAQANAGEREGWEFGVRDGVGVLTMPTWAMYNSKWDWRGFIDAAVDRLIDESARGLVVDLRDNEGGNDCGDHLLRRLVARPLAMPDYRSFVRYRKTPDALAPYLDTWDKSFRDWGDSARPSDRPGYFRLVRAGDSDTGDTIVPAGRRFKGKVAVLVSATCSSATFQFANAVKGQGIATLIGNTTGGNRRGINGGAYFFVRLPATGMEIDLPVIGYFPTRPQPDAGVAADIVVESTIADLAARRDTAMATARQGVSAVS